ncbi:MAG: twitching motility protein PilT [Zetaproteobacteria bacterium CG06_land_8_20_14_3_00_59_53]|nr:MAG: twitching motility protein PilT [Zetaproteobacteria bacterium CG2_30_59_37]PIO90457.1 MAG: twitching motility protein PilT [Zetaproteobacteria bacterium CG23_combo_of_CG06-09_8_20_14_all_59_86]PIQ65928.1 MAG: twitching motility protein PilT [Zetaproteobacteria bacterium CG11_big_fil_rev_8_21_14_0_20_59_439]PIU71408.1 MAG: twitching motility protein PilT [Zetaproteobacteria bacterium CG06_land_8_20_14_3_00_59_53]PIU97664.1 MAG: twitching motility protein PilT [Zetaproteobacteria bacteriu
MAGAHMIDDLLKAAYKNGASDLMLRTGDRVRMRIHGSIVTIPAERITPPSREQVIEMIHHLGNELDGAIDVESLQHLDFHYCLPDIARFRIHIMRTQNNFGIVARVIPVQIPSFEELRLPDIIRTIAEYRNGLVFMGGATGSGKSTTLATMLNHIVQNRPVHAVTIEDPIEFGYGSNHQGTVCQREIGRDVGTFAQGMHDALREAPDVIVVGEVRDRSVAQSALQAAETGHLVMATVHATTATGALQRILGAFQQEEHAAVRKRLAENVRAIIVQKLLRLKNGKGRIVVLEIMIKNSVIKHFMMDADRWREIPRAMEEGHALYGSQTFDLHLQKLVEEDLLDYEEALANAVNPEDFTMRMGRD